jgi:hypothetical protein
VKPAEKQFERDPFDFEHARNDLKKLRADISPGKINPTQAPLINE